jgi:hypothetical protein
MSRTVHHVPLRKRNGGAGIVRSRHQIEDRRYSAAVKREAARMARRPLPSWSLQTSVFTHWPRGTNDAEYGYFQRVETRKRRCHDRTALRRLVMELGGVARRNGALSAADAALDVTPDLSRPVRNIQWNII